MTTNVNIALSATVAMWSDSVGALASYVYSRVSSVGQ